MELALQWIQQQPIFNTNYYDVQPSLAVDSSGNVYIAYTTSGTVSGGTNLGTFDIVVFKMNGTNGLVQWIQQQPTFNTNAYDGQPSLTVDSSGNVYIAYTTGGTVSGGTTLGTPDIVIFKMNGTNGLVQWIQQQPIFNTNAADFEPSLAIDSSGNIYIAYTTNIGTVSGGTKLGKSDIVVFKMNGTNGLVQWIQQQPTFNTNAFDGQPSLTIDSSGNVYIAYRTDDGTVSGGTKLLGSDIVVFKMDTNGLVQWIQQQPTFNTNAFDSEPSLAVDSSGNIYIAYTTEGTVSGGTKLASNDIVVFKMNGTNGLVQWIQQQPTFNTNAYDAQPSIAVDSSGNVYIAYITGGTVSGGTTLGTPDIVVFKMGGTNGLVQWIQQQPTFNTDYNDRQPSLAVDSSGNVYIAYQTLGTVSGGTHLADYDIVVFKLGLVNQIICIFPGGLVFTTNGLKKIEDLRAGDIIFDEFDQQVELINNVQCHPSSKGYTTFYQNCFALNFPSDNLMITDGHPIKTPNSNREIPVERLTNGYDIIHREGPIPETYSLVTKERIFIPINNIPVCTWSESKFHRYAKKEKLEYTLL